MKLMDIPVIAADENGARKITPTDVAQLIRFEQCERFLRLQLHQRNADYNFLASHRIFASGIPPLLNFSGAEFETQFESALQAQMNRINAQSGGQNVGKIKFGAVSDSGDRRRKPDNDEVCQIARNLEIGQTIWLFQPRVVAHLNGWQLRGDIDILKLSRDENGRLQVLIADMKSSSRSRHEHKLQVAFYHHMVREVLGQAQIAHAPIEIGILYRGPRDGGVSLELNDQQMLKQHRENAGKYLQMDVGFYDSTPEREDFFGAVDELVLGSDSLSNRIAQTPNYHDLRFHLGYKCDGCNFNEWCLKSSAQDDDLSVLPHLDEDLKYALQKIGIGTVSELAALKRLRAKDGAIPNDAQGWNELETVPEFASLVQKISSTRGLGSRLDELIHRALAYSDWRAREAGLPRVPHLDYIPSKGYGSLPFCDQSHNPNLVKIFIDTQFDYLQERLYGLSALVVANENGAETHSKHHVHLCDGPPDTPEKEAQLLRDWIQSVLQSVVGLAAPNKDGELRAPIHLIFFNKIEQKTLLEALGRHFSDVVASTPLYDFVTQIASLDGSMATFLNEEMRELKNYPRTCASLHEIASNTYDAQGERFDWNEPLPFKTLFKERIFDGWGKIEHLDDGEQWVQSRARFSSHLPLEYAYAAWNCLPVLKPNQQDDFEPYRKISREDWLSFQARRLDAIKHIADSFKGNKQTEKSEFDLTRIDLNANKAQNLAQALDEFLTLERHAELGGWKHARLAPPERRALSGQSLICKYLHEDQTPENQILIAQNAHNETELAAWRDENPGKRKPNNSFPIDYQMTLRLRLEPAGSGVSCGEILALTTLRAGETVVVAPRWDFDSRLSPPERKPYTPTPKSMLYDMRGEILRIHTDDDTQKVWIEVKVLPPMHGGKDARGWVFGAHNEALQNNTLYSLDSDPNDWHGLHAMRVVEGLVSGEENALLQRLEAPQKAQFSWPEAARLGQEEFLAGLDALAQNDASFVFETSKRNFIGSHGDAPFLLVQGPPGTGKSYASSWALWARIQGALVAGRDLRVLLCCKTHAATDVLLRNMSASLERLKRVQQEQPDLFAQFFDARLLQVPLWRFDPKRPDGWNYNDADAGLIPLPQKKNCEKGAPRAEQTLQESAIGVFAATPGGVFRLCKDAGSSLFDHRWFDVLVVDEASQMNLPEAMMAALPLHPNFALIVVGDPRQMPPIVKNDWQSEARRTFREFKAFASLYDSVAALDDETANGQRPIVARIAFQESFRLHRDMAEFLRREIYAQDKIRFHSHQLQVLADKAHNDPFVAAVLNPAHSLIVITHDESQSILENQSEADLIRPLLEVLADETEHALDAKKGLGIVVPHRAQRALLQDPRWYVETVEKFQGDERLAMLFCATESDRAYLNKGGFLFDPRRLNVALSRAKHKMILVAGQTVFAGFHADEETFNNAQLWKNLLRHTCNVSLWKGEREGMQVQVWGNDLNLHQA